MYVMWGAALLHDQKLLACYSSFMPPPPYLIAPSSHGFFLLIPQASSSQKSQTLLLSIIPPVLNTLSLRLHLDNVWSFSRLTPCPHPHFSCRKPFSVLPKSGGSSLFLRMSSASLFIPLTLLSLQWLEAQLYLLSSQHKKSVPMSLSVTHWTLREYMLNK